MNRLERLRDALLALEAHPDRDTILNVLAPYQGSTYGRSCPVALYLQQACGFEVEVLSTLAYPVKTLNPEEDVHGTVPLPTHVRQFVRAYDHRHFES